MTITAPLHVDDLDLLRRRRSAKWRSYPDNVLPLPVAEMDFPLAPAVQQRLADAVARSDTGYGVADTELSTSLTRFAADRWGWSIDPDHVGHGADVGVACVDLLRILCKPGDKVLISPPVYPPFFHWIAEVGATVAEAPMRQGPSGAWMLDLEALAQAFAARPAAYVLCNPQNPVGRVHHADELVEVARLAARYDVVVVSDEIHAPLVLPGARFTPFLTVPGGAEAGISLLSASKAWNLAGLKCASIVTASDRMQQISERRPPDARWRVGQFGILATLAAYDESRDWLDALVETLAQRRGQLDELISSNLPEIAWTPPEATYLAWLDCTSIGSGSRPRDLFLERGRVALEPGPDFGSVGSGWVRLNFGTSAEILTEAVQRMRAALDAR
jgi:cysteine-S-conjugate beta-lyase